MMWVQYKYFILGCQGKAFYAKSISTVQYSARLKAHTLPIHALKEPQGHMTVLEQYRQVANSRFRCPRDM